VTIQSGYKGVLLCSGLQWGTSDPHYEYVYSPQRQNTNQINTAHRNKTEKNKKKHTNV